MARYMHYKEASRNSPAHTHQGDLDMPELHTGGEPQRQNNARHFDRTIRGLETKLGRQQAAVADTLEMIEAVKALKEKETTPHATQISGKK